MKITGLEYKYVKAEQKTGTIGVKGNGYCSIISSDNNGKRVSWSKEVEEKLQLQDADMLHISQTDDNIIVSKDKLSEYSKGFRLRKAKDRLVTYCSSLVEMFTEFLAIDFSDRVCYTVTNASFETVDEAEEETYVLVINKVNQQEEVFDVVEMKEEVNND